MLNVIKFQMANISPEALSASASEIAAVVHLTDRMSASEPLNGSKNVIGIDLAEDIGSHLPARYTTCDKKPVKRCCIDTKRPVMNSDFSQEQQTRLEVMYLFSDLFCHNFSLLKNEFQLYLMKDIISYITEVELVSTLYVKYPKDAEFLCSSVYFHP